MTSVVALDGVTSFLHLINVTNTCNRMQHSPLLLVGFLQCNGGKLEEAEDFKCFFDLYCVLELKQISLVCELLSKLLSTLFVGQL